MHSNFPRKPVSAILERRKALTFCVRERYAQPGSIGMKQVPRPLNHARQAGVNHVANDVLDPLSTT